MAQQTFVRMALASLAVTEVVDLATARGQAGGLGMTLAMARGLVGGLVMINHNIKGMAGNKIIT